MMNDLYKLLFFTPSTQKLLGLISDSKLENILNYLVDIDLLTLRLAQLKYNNRIKNEETVWWDNLEVYIGLPPHNLRNFDLLNLSTSVPFGLLYDVFRISTSNQKIAILHNWNVLDEDQFFHTDVDTFSTQCLAHEWEIKESEGIFENYSKKEWGMEQRELSDQIRNYPHENHVKKKTLAIIEIIQFREGRQGYQSLKTVLEVFRLLKEDSIKFSEIEGFIPFDREIATKVGGYINENKPVKDFDLKDFFEFGLFMIDLEFYFDGFDHFLNFTQLKILEDITETFTQTDQTILKDLCEKYLRNQESLNT